MPSSRLGCLLSLQTANMGNPRLKGREFTISTVPFANPGDRVRSVDDASRPLTAGLVTTVSTDAWSLLYSIDEAMSELYNLESDPKQQKNVIGGRPEVAKELHQYLVKFMRDTNLAPHLMNPRLELRL